MADGPVPLPALVAPGPPLAPERLARFSRQLLMPGFGELAQRRLEAARVLVIGAGGLGSASIPYLVAAGIRTIGVADDDVVELSNLHRQVAHRLADLGTAKVDSIARAALAIDPDITVNRHRVRLDSGNILGILAEYDLLLDGSDNFATRYLSNDAAQLQHKPLVWGAILRYGGQAGVAWADHGPTYRDLFPVPPRPEDVLSCASGGVLPSVCAAIGAIMSSETIKLITGTGSPLIGRVTSYDALTGRFREIDYGRSPDADVVTRLADYDLFCGTRKRGAAMAEATSDETTPAESTPAERIDARTLATRLGAGEALQLLDVREPFEAQLVSLPGAELIPLAGLESELGRVRRDVPVVVYCHGGIRSQQAAALLRGHGMDNVQDLIGGIDAYSREVDPTLPRY